MMCTAMLTGHVTPMTRGICVIRCDEQINILVVTRGLSTSTAWQQLLKRVAVAADVEGSMLKLLPYLTLCFSATSQAPNVTKSAMMRSGRETDTSSSRALKGLGRWSYLQCDQQFPSRFPYC
jgi:hypothetical protein